MTYAITDPRHPDLAFFFTMDKLVGSTVIDQAGNYNGVNNGAVSETGKFRNALKFNGGQSISMPAVNLAKTDASLAFWLKPAGLTGDNATRQYLYSSQKDPASGSGYTYTYQTRLGMHISADYLECQVPGGVTVPASTYPLTEGLWYFVVLVSALGSPPKIFIDAVVRATGAVNRPTVGFDHNETWIGRRADPQGEDYCKSALDHFRVFKKALTQAEIDELFAEQPIHIAGSVMVDGSPAIVPVRIYDEADGRLLNDGTSAADGTYSIPVYTFEPVHVMAIPGAGRQPLVHGPITPLLAA